MVFEWLNVLLGDQDDILKFYTSEKLKALKSRGGNYINSHMLPNKCKENTNCPNIAKDSNP